MLERVVVRVPLEREVCVDPLWSAQVDKGG